MGYVVSVPEVWIEDERIEAMRNWLEPKLIKNIQVFLGLANFYQQFIQGFSKIVGLSILTFWIAGSSKNLLLIVDIVESDKIDTLSGAGVCEDEKVKRSLLKNSNRAMRCLTSEAKIVFT